MTFWNAILKRKTGLKARTPVTRLFLPVFPITKIVKLETHTTCILQLDSIYYIFMIDIYISHSHIHETVQGVYILDNDILKMVAATH
jgi:hypothetical protein